MKTETARHRDAFEFYYIMGDKRTLRAVAQEFTVSVQALARWNKDFDWQNRIKLRDRKIAEKVEKKTDDDIVKTKARYRKIIRLLIDKANEKIKDGTLNPEDIQDVERMMKLDMLMLGEATERQAIIEIKMPEGIEIED